MLDRGTPARYPWRCARTRWPAPLRRWRPSRSDAAAAGIRTRWRIQVRYSLQRPCIWVRVHSIGQREWRHTNITMQRMSLCMPSYCCARWINLPRHGTSLPAAGSAHSCCYHGKRCRLSASLMSADFEPDDGLVCTVGKLSVWPGASNVIAGSTNFTVRPALTNTVPISADVGNAGPYPCLKPLLTPHLGFRVRGHLE